MASVAKATAFSLLTLTSIQKQHEGPEDKSMHQHTHSVVQVSSLHAATTKHEQMKGKGTSLMLSRQFLAQNAKVRQELQGAP